MGELDYWVLNGAHRNFFSQSVQYWTETPPASA